MRNLTRSILLVGISTLAAGQALAQPADNAAPAASGGNGGVADIVVTAQRRAENLTSVPLSISAQTGQTLAANGIKQLSEVKFTTPGFISAAGTGYTQIYIRGIGNAIFVGADPSVATFIDDVPRIYGSLVEDLVNVDRVEILKGAQGGLYGRNASGGVINIITKQPSDKFSALARVTGGEYGTLQASAYVNMPLNDHIAWNFSLTRNQHGPYLKNIAPKNPYPNHAFNVYGERLNDLSNPGKINAQNLWSFDTKFRVKLGDRAKITLGVDYTDKKDTDGNGWIDRDPSASYGTYKFLMGLLAPSVTPLGCTLGAPSRLPHLAAMGEARDKIGQGLRRAYPYASWTEDYGASARAELNTDFAALTSITAFRWNNSHFQGDVGAAPVPIAGFSTHFHRRYFYQELRAVSNGSGPFHWLGGATYFHDNVDVSIASILVGHFAAPTISQYHTTNWSVYGQGSYDITDNLTFQASLRYANETKTVNFPAGPGPTFDFPGGTDRPAITSQTKVHKFIPAATISYKVSGGVIYARYAKGFKTGGPNPLVLGPGPAAAGAADRPEPQAGDRGHLRGRLSRHAVRPQGAVHQRDLLQQVQEHPRHHFGHGPIQYRYLQRAHQPRHGADLWRRGVDRLARRSAGHRVVERRLSQRQVPEGGIQPPGRQPARTPESVAESAQLQRQRHDPGAEIPGRFPDQP